MKLLRFGGVLVVCAATLIAGFAISQLFLPSIPNTKESETTLFVLTEQERADRQKYIEAISRPQKIIAAPNDITIEIPNHDLTVTYGQKTGPVSIKSLVITGVSPNGIGKVYHIYGTQTIGTSEKLVVNGQCNLGIPSAKDECVFELLELSPKTSQVTIELQGFEFSTAVSLKRGQKQIITLPLPSDTKNLSFNFQVS